MKYVIAAFILAMTVPSVVKAEYPYGPAPIAPLMQGIYGGSHGMASPYTMYPTYPSYGGGYGGCSYGGCGRYPAWGMSPWARRHRWAGACGRPMYGMRWGAYHRGCGGARNVRRFSMNLGIRIGGFSLALNINSFSSNRYY